MQAFEEREEANPPRGLGLGTLDPAPDPCYVNRVW